MKNIKNEIKKAFETSEERASDIGLYDQALNEFNSDKDGGIYAKALSLSEGDELKTKAKYLELRVEILKSEQKEHQNKLEGEKRAHARSIKEKELEIKGKKDHEVAVELIERINILKTKQFKDLSILLMVTGALFLLLSFFISEYIDSSLVVISSISIGVLGICVFLLFRKIKKQKNVFKNRVFINIFYIITFIFSLGATALFAFISPIFAIFGFIAVIKFGNECVKYNLSFGKIINK